jgi:hypothetical protein
MKDLADIVEPERANQVPLARQHDDPAVLDEEAQRLADGSLRESETDRELRLEDGLPGLETGVEDLLTETAVNSLSQERPAVGGLFVRPRDLSDIHAGSVPQKLTSTG